MPPATSCACARPASAMSSTTIQCSPASATPDMAGCRAARRELRSLGHGQGKPRADGLRRRQRRHAARLRCDYRQRAPRLRCQRRWGGRPRRPRRAATAHVPASTARRRSVVMSMTAAAGTLLAGSSAGGKAVFGPRCQRSGPRWPLATCCGVHRRRSRRGRASGADRAHARQRAPVVVLFGNGYNGTSSNAVLCRARCAGGVQLAKIVLPVMAPAVSRFGRLGIPTAIWSPMPSTPATCSATWEVRPQWQRRRLAGGARRPAVVHGAPARPGSQPITDAADRR